MFQASQPTSNPLSSISLLMDGSKKKYLGKDMNNRFDMCGFAKET